MNGLDIYYNQIYNMFWNRRRAIVSPAEEPIISPLYVNPLWRSINVDIPVWREIETAEVSTIVWERRVVEARRATRLMSLTANDGIAEKEKLRASISNFIIHNPDNTFDIVINRPTSSCPIALYNTDETVIISSLG
tara:strand:+ start:716 stop:1123 length:408 start_codon:yes stop_codon:yes gene_type:complete